MSYDIAEIHALIVFLHCSNVLCSVFTNIELIAVLLSKFASGFDQVRVCEYRTNQCLNCILWMRLCVRAVYMF